MTDEIDDEIVKEGGYVNDPNDPGGRTIYGISEKAFPDAWKHGTPSYQTARDIYQQKFLVGAKIGQIPDPDIQHQILDWSINSGPGVAISHLQAILGVHADGVLGPATLAALSHANVVSVSNQLVDARILMLCRVVQKNPKLLPDLLGLVTRALSFRR